MTTSESIADAITLSHLGYSYPGDQNPVLNIPAWRVERNEHVFLQGESGSGKSTLLSLLAGLSIPTQGSLQILGDDIAKQSARQRDRFRATNLGVVFQQFNLIPYLSALDNILLAARFGSATTAGARQRDDAIGADESAEHPAPPPRVADEHWSATARRDCASAHEQSVAVADRRTDLGP